MIRYRTKVVKENLRNSFPEKSNRELITIKRQFYKNLCDVSLESLKLLSITKEELKKRIHITNFELPLSTLNSERSHIVLTSHLCNWEWLLQICTLQSTYPIYAVYKPLTNTEMNRFFHKMRARFGAKPVAMKDTLKELVRNRTEVKSLAMVADQTPPLSEIQHWQLFLHQRTPFYIGADKIGGSMQFPVFFAGMKRIRRGYYEVSFELLKELPLSKEGHEVTSRFIHTLEQKINQQPADWLWSHKRWKHKEPKIIRKGTVTE